MMRVVQGEVRMCGEAINIQYSSAKYICGIYCY